VNPHPPIASPVINHSQTNSSTSTIDPKSVDPERVIQNILNRYGLEKVPEASEAQTKRSYDIIDSVLRGRHQAGNPSDVTNRDRSPNVNYLSPLQSSKNGTFGGGIDFLKDDEGRSLSIGSPDGATGRLGEVDKVSNN
jgi:hypothetical protein